jgi:hypothetical protein
MPAKRPHPIAPPRERHADRLTQTRTKQQPPWNSPASADTVVGAAAAAHRLLGAGEAASLAEGKRDVLPPLVEVMDERVPGSTSLKRLLERVDDELCTEMVFKCSADHASGVAARPRSRSQRHEVGARASGLTHVYSASGAFTITLTCLDSAGYTATTTTLSR